MARDDVEAYKWLTLSNGWGYDTPATLAELESRMTKGEISEAKQRVEEWRKGHGDKPAKDRPFFHVRTCHVA